MLFQAMTRLRHYQLFPTMHIDDNDIDLDAVDTWHELPHEIQNSYIKTYEDSLQLTTNMRKKMLFPVTMADSPFRWYKRVTEKRYWGQRNDLDTIPNSVTMIATWAAMSRANRTPYINLNKLDEKRCNAARIEEVLASKGIMIGSTDIILGNIIVKTFTIDATITKVSTILTHKLSKSCSKNDTTKMQPFNWNNHSAS